MATQEKVDILLSDYNLLEKYSEDLFRFMPLPTALLSPLEVILEFNPAFEKISGYKSEEAVGANIKKLFKKKEIESVLRECFKRGKVEGKEISLVRKNGAYIPVSVFASIRKVGRRKGGYFISLFDLRKIKEKEEKLKEINATLEIRVKARERELRELSQELERRVEQRKKEIKEKIRELDAIRRKIVERELLMIRLKKENILLKRKIEELEKNFYGRE